MTIGGCCCCEGVGDNDPDWTWDIELEPGPVFDVELDDPAVTVEVRSLGVLPTAPDPTKKPAAEVGCAASVRLLPTFCFGPGDFAPVGLLMVV